jgi:maltooligosyltrehalose trehalohydrolase
MGIGVYYLGDERCAFSLWAPFLVDVAVKIVSPVEHILPMKRTEKGYWKVILDNIQPGALYFYNLEDKIDRPDPASNFQPEGVNGPSQIIGDL